MTVRFDRLLIDGSLTKGKLMEQWEQSQEWNGLSEMEYKKGRTYLWLLFGCAARGNSRTGGGIVENLGSKEFHVYSLTIENRRTCSCADG